jgi:hypothetical protein
MRKKGLIEKGSDRTAGDYQIGYASPPRWTQFRAGQSGNPSGRPKRKNVAGMARAVLEREVPATGSRQKMIVRDVALRKLADKAAAGDQRALAFLLVLADERDSAEPAPPNAAVSDSHDLEIIQEFIKRQQSKIRTRT